MRKWNTVPLCPKCNGRTKPSKLEEKYICKKCNYILTKKEVKKFFTQEVYGNHKNNK